MDSSYTIATHRSSGSSEEETIHVNLEGYLHDHTVEEADGQTSKGWFVVAMVIGGLMFVGTGFGILGLLHVYGIALPQFLQPMASAIGSIGPEALWALTGGGGALGIGLFVWGAYKLYKDPTRFGDRFAEFGVHKPTQKSIGHKGGMEESTYELAYVEPATTGIPTMHFRRCVPGGAVECTGPLTLKQRAELREILDQSGYTEANVWSN